MKILIAVCFCISLVVCEPPVPSNRYLPANSGFNGLNAPSSSYGAPASPSSQYGAPPSSQYGAPGIGGGIGGRQNGNGLRQNYGPPPTAGQNGFNGGARRPSSNYGAPARTPSSSYGAPNAVTAAIIRPSTEYGAPQPNNAYLPPSGAGGYNYNGNNGGRNGGYDEGPSEPANYQFEYMVNDPPSGNDFGHMESRQGDFTQGKYYVVLPDGRKQIVEYEADVNGYRPKISYEEGFGGAGGAGGYGRGPAIGGYNNGGYSNGGYQNGGSNGGGYNNGGASNGGYNNGASNGGYNY